MNKQYNLTIIINGTFDEEKALYNNDSEEVIVTGDYYHNKIDEFINGFIKGLIYCGYAVNVREMTIKPEDVLFSICDFYDGSED